MLKKYLNYLQERLKCVIIDIIIDYYAAGTAVFAAEMRNYK